MDDGCLAVDTKHTKPPRPWQEDDCHDALLCAVANKDLRDVDRWGRICARHGLLDKRSTSTHSGLALVAPPHILATYYGDAATLEELLLHLGDDVLDEHASGWCRGCSVGQTALQLACSKGAKECVRMLLRLGAQATLPFCFHVEAADLPNARHSDAELIECNSPICGIAAYSAYMLSGHQSSSMHAVCRTLLCEHGASTANHPDSECPICYELLFGGDNCEPVTTTACLHCFHSCCLPMSVHVCPLCRTPLVRRAVEATVAAVGQMETSTGSLPRDAGDASTWVAAVTAEAGSVRGGSPGSVSARAQVENYARAEPPYLLSPSFAEPQVRIYTELERRRM